MSKLTKEYLIIAILPIAMIVYAFVVNTPYELYLGIRRIICANDILISDYFIIGGIGPAFLNAGLIMIFSMLIMYYMQLRLNGLLIASLFLMLSFGLMGKNLLNIIPFYIGGYLNSIILKKGFKSLIAATMMATTLSPIVSSIPYFGVFIAIFLGFSLPIISKHVIHLHSGYNLYNTGLAGGLVGIVLYSLLKSNGIKFDLNSTYYTEYNYYIFAFFLIYFILLMLIGYFYESDFKTNLKYVYRHTGRLVTDFVQKEGFYISIFNMGCLGILSLLITLWYQRINGPVICGMMTVVAFGGFGKHLKNILPIIVGIISASYIFSVNLSPTIFLMTLFFSTTLAPIAGKFGIIAGLIAGMMHYATATQIGEIHGGINLYNNGLAAGVVASVLLPLINTVSEVKLTWKRRKRK